ncbi:MAG: hypothetical protein EOP55_00010 [Sphingobacteriales bacterium]|nr:MAG: hypothetical protein EOP55_00010 [Sphingobacteriales bacterium]
MEPFNIRIKHKWRYITLTILPFDEKYFDVIYFGGILGVLCKKRHRYTSIGLEKIIGRDLPFYSDKYKKDADRLNLKFTDKLAAKVVLEIENVLNPPAPEHLCDLAM